MGKKFLITTYLLDKLMTALLSVSKTIIYGVSVGLFMNLFSANMINSHIMTDLTPFIIYTMILFIAESVVLALEFQKTYTGHDLKRLLQCFIFYTTLLSASIVTIELATLDLIKAFVNAAIAFGIIWVFLKVWQYYHNYAVTDTVLLNTDSIVLDETLPTDELFNKLKQQTIKPEFLEFIDIESVSIPRKLGYFQGKEFGTDETVRRPYKHQEIQIKFTFAGTNLFGANVLKKYYRGESN